MSQDHAAAELFDTAKIQALTNLSRLALTPTEAVHTAEHLSRMVAHVHKLAELNLEAVVPSGPGVQTVANLRPDETQLSLPIDVVMQNAPERLGDGFAVPKIVE